MVSRNSQHGLSAWLLRTSCCWKTDCWEKKTCDLRRERRMGGTHPLWARPCSSPDRSPAVMGTTPQPLAARSIPAAAPSCDFVHGYFLRPGAALLSGRSCCQQCWLTLHQPAMPTAPGASRALIVTRLQCCTHPPMDFVDVQKAQASKH